MPGKAARITITERQHDILTALCNAVTAPSLLRQCASLPFDALRIREAAIQPHKSRYWLNTTEKDPVRFQEQVEAVCDTYQAAPEMEKKQ